MGDVEVHVQTLNDVRVKREEVVLAGAPSSEAKSIRR